MPNQALAFHRISRRVYDLTGLRTGSVRDQLLRSNLVVHCLADEKIITKSLPLLIFGAGAAGINAAIIAASRGISVDVIEVNDKPFANLCVASWRRVDAVEYDWPHPHYHLGSSPFSKSGIALSQPSATADELSKAWEKEWHWWNLSRNGVAHRGKVTLMMSVNARAFASGIVDIPGSGQVTVSGPWDQGQTKSLRPYGAVLSCVGFGPERTADEKTPSRWNDYRGPSFWLDDDDVVKGNAKPLRFNTVVISGGGDGAMQDFQRVTTGEFGKALLHKLISAAQSLLPPVDLTPDKLIRVIVAAEEAGRRAYAWQRAAQPISTMMKTWHNTFVSEVQSLFRSLPTEQVEMLAKIVLRPEFFTGNLVVTWLYKEPTPGYAYALNRYLSLVIQQLASVATLERGQTVIHIMPANEITQISPTKNGHCCISPRGCLGELHQVTLESSADGRRIIDDADLIIIRHGTVPDPLLASGPPVPEQMPPFDIPH